MKERQKGFFSRYKKHILIAVAIYGLLTALLIFLSSGPQDQPFNYLVF